MTVAIFLAGIFVGTFSASGLFFLKFWKASRDSFFLYFAIACWLMVLERIVAITLEGFFQIITTGSENLAWVYLIRLSAFAVILAAILKKNSQKER